MKNSNRFIQLKSRIDSLKDNLLPRTRIDGNYSEIEQDLIRGFILLVHAEIENFIEDRVEEKIDAVHNLWKTSRKKSHVISSMNSFCNFDARFMAIGCNNLPLMYMVFSFAGKIFL